MLYSNHIPFPITINYSKTVKKESDTKSMIMIL